MAIDLVTMEKAGVDIVALKAALEAGNMDVLLQGADKVKAYVRSEDNRTKALQAARDAANVVKAGGASNILADAMGKMLTHPRILEAFGSLAEIWPEDGKAVLLNINIKSRDFRISLPSAAKPVKENSSGRAGQALTVDGVTYVSASAARDALLPDKKGAPMNRLSIMSALRTAKHTIS